MKESSRIIAWIVLILWFAFFSSTGVLAQTAFVYRVSKKTGNVYKRYLPEVTVQLQKEGKL